MAHGIATHSAIFGVGPKDQTDRVYSGPKETVLLTVTIDARQAPGGVQVMVNGAAVADGLLLSGSTETQTLKLVDAQTVDLQIRGDLRLTGTYTISVPL